MLHIPAHKQITQKFQPTDVQMLDKYHDLVAFGVDPSDAEEQAFSMDWEDEE